MILLIVLSLALLSATAAAPPTNTAAPAVGLRVNVPIINAVRGDPALDASNWGIVTAGKISPAGGFAQMRLVGDSEGMQIYVQVMTPTANGSQFTLSLNGAAQKVTHSATAGWSFTERCGGADYTNCRGWAAEKLIPWSQLGGKPAEGTEWPLALRVGDYEWAGTLHWGLPGYAGVAAAGAQEATAALGADSMLGGSTDCGSADYPDYFPTWGARNWGVSPHVNVQAQWDTADWPCYSRYYAAWPLNKLPPGAQVISATIEMYQFGNPGYDAGYNEDGTLNTINGTGETIMQIYEVDQPWQEESISWDNAPAPVENTARTLVRPLPRDCQPWGSWYCYPGIPYTFDVTEIVKRAQADGRDWASMALYTAGGQYHSGKYFSSREGSEPPIVRIIYTLGGGLPWTLALTSTPPAQPTRTNTATPTASLTPTAPSSTATRTAASTSSPTPAAQGRTFYIAPGGNDAASGSQSAPWRTFSRAWNSLLPGDTLLLLDGTYREQLIPTRSGQAGKPITVRALNDGKATIDGRFQYQTVQLNVDWYVLDGLVVRNGYGATIRVNSHNNVLRRISAYDASTDINSTVFWLSGNNNLVEDSVAAGMGRYMFEVYEGNNNTLRRAVAMYGAWSGEDFCGVSWPHGYNVGVYNGSNNTVENVLAYGRAPSAGIMVQANHETAVADNNHVLGSMALLSGRDYDGSLWTYGTAQEQPTSRPGPTTCPDNITQWDWGTQRVGLLLFGQGTLRGNVFRDVLAVDNMGVGFVAGQPYSAGAKANNVLDRAQLTGNGDGAADWERSQGGQVHNGLDVQVLPGAPRLNLRYANRVLTTQAVLPWPMQARIQAELGVDVGAIWQKYAGEVR